MTCIPTDKFLSLIFSSLLLMLTQNVVMVEALKNIGGISYFTDYFSYGDLNLRKFQALHCAQSSSSMIVNNSTASTTSDAAADAAPAGGDLSAGADCDKGDAEVDEEDQNV